MRKIKKLLILHGFMHSGALYEGLAADLRKSCACQIEFYEFPGFGGVPEKYRRNLLDNYARDLRLYLATREYDCILAHSMGGAVLLRVLRWVPERTKVILLSPEYLGIDVLKPVAALKPVLPLLIAGLQLPCPATDFLIRLMSLFTIHRWKDIDKSIVDCARSASPAVAAAMMCELVLDSYRIWQPRSRNTYLVIGGKDRIITRAKMVKLYEDLGKCRVFCVKNSGHTLVLENRRALSEMVKKVLSAALIIDFCDNDTKTLF